MIKNIYFFCQSLVNAKTYINSAQEFGRNASLWKEWHKKTLYPKIFHIGTPCNPSGFNYCYFRENNISPLVLLLPLPARWRWTRAPAVGRMSVDMLPGSQQVTSTPVHLYSCTLCKVCTTHKMNWESFKLGSKNSLTIISFYQSLCCYHQSKSQKGGWDIVLSQQKLFVCYPGKYSISQNAVVPLLIATIQGNEIGNYVLTMSKNLRYLMHSPPSLTIYIVSKIF